MKDQLNQMTNTEVVYKGISLGSALAIVISWGLNKSIAWAVFHGVLSWVYIVYYYFYLR